MSAGLPPTRRLSASGSMDHLQRLGSAGLVGSAGGGGGTVGGQHYGSRGSLPGSLPGSMAGSLRGSGGGGMGLPLGPRLGSADGGHPGMQLSSASAAATRLQSLGSAGASSCNVVDT